MTSHHTHHHHGTSEAQGPETEACCSYCEKDSNFSAYLIGAAVLVGAILVSASVFFNTKIVLKRLDTGSLALTAEQQQEGTAPSGNQAQAPSQPVEFSLRKSAPVIGKSDAKLAIVVFSDFQCPYCAKFYNDAYASIKQNYLDTGKAKMVFLNYVLPFHQNAQKAAEAAECANRQGKYEQYQQTLFTKGQPDGTGLAVADLKKYAQDLGLNVSNFNQCLDSGEMAAAVKQDSESGAKVNVSGTPSMLLIKNNNMTFDVGYIKNQTQAGKGTVSLPNGNGFVVGAQPFSSFQQVIDAALK